MLRISFSYAWMCDTHIHTSYEYDHENLALIKMRCFNHSVQFRRSILSESLWPHGLQHARPPCPSPTPGLTQTHVHGVSGASQPSHPLSSPSPPAFNLSKHQGLFKRVSSSHQVARVLELQLQLQSFQCIFRTDLLLGWTAWISLQSKGLSTVFSNSTVQKHQFFRAQLSL